MTFLSQEQLNILCINLMQNVEDLLVSLDVDLKKQKKTWIGCCPIHGGDKYNAFNLYDDGDDNTGFWRCRTHNCHNYFIGNIIGFVRGVLSRQRYNWYRPNDKQATFEETIDYIANYLKCDPNSIITNTPEFEQKRFLRSVPVYHQRILMSTMTRDEFRKTVALPSDYFIKRHFNSDILNKYDVGTCHSPTSEYFNRATIPVYSDDHKYVVGVTARSLFEKCPVCNTWHNKNRGCPSTNELFKYPKWQHSTDFKKNDYLYNYWYAKEHIYRTKTVILVESPGNVWKLEEAGLPIGLATFGTSLSDTQISLLNKAGAMSVIIIGDNDNAGRDYNIMVRDKLRHMFDTHIIVPSKNDVAEMDIEEIKQVIKPKCFQCKEMWTC
jgi:5S rRNA maturation endonuclease (ribonuclease M5)